MKTPKPHHLPPRFSWRFLLPQYWPTWLLLAMARLLAFLPFNSLIALGRGLGQLFYKLAPRRVSIAAANINQCFSELSESERHALIKETVINTGIGAIETLIALFGPRTHFTGRATIHGLEHLDSDTGILLVGCHMTTLEIAGRLLAKEHTFDILYRRDPNPLLAWAFVRARGKYNGESILSVETRRLVRHLQQGRTVWYAPDQDYGIKHSLFAPFFGIPAATVPGTAHFSRLGRAKVVFFSHYRDAQNHYHIELTPAPVNFPTDDDAIDCSLVNARFEAMIRKAPSQYLWVHRRFKTRPLGEPSLYSRKK